MDALADIRLVDGPILWAAWAGGAAGALHLLWRRGRHWPLVPVLAVVSAALIVAAVHWLLIYVFSTFPEELPREVLGWSVPAVVGVLLWTTRLGSAGWKGRGAATAAMLGLVLLSSVQTNAYFGLNRTVGDLLGTAVARIPPLEAGLTRQAGRGVPVQPAEWVRPEGLPSEGVLRKAHIPGTSSGFDARDAYIYLPPAYLSPQRPALPVLVLFSGQPGGPADWLTGGALRSHMDRFSARHNGVAPVVVVVDPNGSSSGNSLCMDSRIAKADTYLSVDVPRWISETLDVDAERRNWGVGGFSFGGTCAMQLGTRHPELYSSILAFASEQEPALAKEREKTVEASFGGDTKAFEAQTPLYLMNQRSFEGSAVHFAAGAADPEFMGYMDVLSAAAREAGFEVQVRRIANSGHSWDTVSNGMQDALDFLASRWGIAP
ncbi:alpha/beta hydrolase family protein [Arthrobacter sp. ISL-28]|uniref:alpha/beta hydrolase n=1 Tax=Arthrobacter sp. ISL-28 TaxID=2819108 RepID=UPI001BE9D029|nr:alpha/beta hydrolase-fold protein [Arthrobacter sp. ISL-28]MBT2522847.1 esterase [Arthrobacter sp. ISL-28]